ncbi:MAG TPA: integrase core domain-containing protein [Candidatus Micrarchaeaceae archaeon]|nr:integrase core domain-containing protein [Candidatus Micrarchaeaceae archaeon]
MRRRMRAVRLAAGSGIEAAIAAGFSRRSVFRWTALYNAGGIQALIPRSRARRQAQAAVPEWVNRVIVAVRLSTYWNSKRIAAELERRQVYKVGHTYIDGFFKEHGCSRGSVAPAPGPRYERSRPNELWHIDIKGPFFIQLAGRGYLKTWLFGLVDDHSRFLIGLQINTDSQAAPILRWLEDCFELCGKPLQLMSDNGNPFVVWMPGVLTRFGKRLRDLKIRHIRTQISTPWTNGKIEAFWEVLQSEVLDRHWFTSLAQAEGALRSFADYYNFHRLSGTLGWQTPAERYLGIPFADRGFEHIPALKHLQPWLEALMATAAA